MHWDIIRHRVGDSLDASILLPLTLSWLVTVRANFILFPHIRFVLFENLTLFCLAFSFSSSADSLDEIVGLDISYHGAQMLETITDENSSHEQYVEEHRQRRREQREQRGKNNLRRRVFLLDLSNSLTRGQSRQQQFQQQQQQLQQQQQQLGKNARSEIQEAPLGV